MINLYVCVFFKAYCYVCPYVFPEQIFCSTTFKFIPQKEHNFAFLMMRFINNSDPMAAGNWKDGGMEMTKREVEKTE